MGLLQNLSELLETDFSSSNNKDLKMDHVFAFWLLSSWCLLSGLWMVDSLEPSVTAWIVTLEKDWKTGGRVEMTRVATNLENDHIVEWRTENPIVTLRWGDRTNIHESRYKFETKQTGIGETTQEFNITNLKRSDDNKYGCNINKQLQGGGNVILANSTIRLRVYSSNESFPICSPEGPITVDAGTQLNIRCSSDTGNSSITVSQFPSTPKNYSWTTSTVNGTALRSLVFKPVITDNNLTFTCSIFSMAYNDNHNCNIGPISVTAPTNPSAPRSSVALIAGTSVGGAAGLLLILILLLIYRKQFPCTSKHTSSRFSKDLTSNPIISANATSQPSVYENAALDVSDNTQDYEQKPFNERSQVRTSERPEPEAGVLYACPSSSAKENPTEYNPPVYAKPNKPQAAVDAATDRYDEQRYSNPVFDHTDPDSSIAPMREGTSPALKLTAMVPPFTKVPMKPQPYKPKGERASDSHDGIAYHQGRGESTRPKSTPSLPPTDVHALTASENRDPYAEPSSPGGKTMYTEVSVPQIKTSGDRDKPSLPDHLVYADLNLKPDSSEDVGQPVISEEPVAVYARVMKNRPNSEETM